MDKTTLKRLAGVLAAAACLDGGAAATVAVVPTLPAAGERVAIQLTNSAWVEHVPATRFTRNGSAIVVDYEFLRFDFGPGYPAPFRPVPIGELVPGNYSLHVRMFDADLPMLAPQTLDRNFAVMPPQALGMTLVPRAPGAWEALNVVLRSAVYFDPATLRAAVSGNLVRVDFDYAPDAPAGGGPGPEGFSAFGSAAIEGLAPGAYRMEGFGRALPDGTPTHYFSLDFTIGTALPVFEYYHEVLRHYFMAGGPDEVALLDAGGHGGWKRTGQYFKAWLHQSEAPANARPVCRFYAAGPNSHFFTADAFECQQLKDIEQSQRAQAVAAGAPFLGWAYEAIGFWALMPAAGACEAGSDPVFRAYNNRAAQGDSNHHFTRDPLLHQAMVTQWSDEGVQLCSTR